MHGGRTRRGHAPARLRNRKTSPSSGLQVVQSPDPRRFVSFAFVTPKAAFGLHRRRDRHHYQQSRPNGLRPASRYLARVEKPSLTFVGAGLVFSLLSVALETRGGGRLVAYAFRRFINVFQYGMSARQRPEITQPPASAIPPAPLASRSRGRPDYRASKESSRWATFIQARSSG